MIMTVLARGLDISTMIFVNKVNRVIIRCGNTTNMNDITFMKMLEQFPKLMTPNTDP